MNEPISTSLYEQSPDFTLKDLATKIPRHCFVGKLWRSVLWFFFDIAVIAGLFAWSLTIDNWLLWPVYWFFQGSALWSLFMIGHDCGHRSFSKKTWINNLFGHLSHTPLLVPFHGWRISHRKHHRNTGHYRHDESHVPLSKKTYLKVRQSLSFRLLMTIYYLGLYFPLYLLINRRRDLKMNHFLPSSLLFTPDEKWDVLTSTFLWLLMLGGLMTASLHFGFEQVLFVYWIPWAIFIVWLDTVTYLQHTDIRLPWYRDGKWTFLQGSFSTIDRNYGAFFNFLHHRIGSHHTIHHLFAAIPHYHLVEASDAIADLAGPWMLRCDRHIFRSYSESVRGCKFIADAGDVSFFEPDSAATEEVAELVPRPAN